MGRKPGTLVKGDIVSKLMGRELSRRQAVRIFNFILDEMKDALRRGEEVEWPFGSLKKVRHPHKPRRGWFLKKIATIYKRQFTVALVDEQEIELEDPVEAAKKSRDKRRQILKTTLAKQRELSLELMKMNAEDREALILASKQPFRKV